MKKDKRKNIKFKLQESKSLSPQQEGLLNGATRQAIARGEVSTQLLKNLCRFGIYVENIPIYAKVPLVFLENYVSSDLPDYEGKKYKDYFIIFAQDETNAIVRLQGKNRNNFIDRSITINEILAYEDEVESNNYLNYEDAYQEALNMRGEII